MRLENVLALLIVVLLLVNMLPAMSVSADDNKTEAYATATENADVSAQSEMGDSSDSDGAGEEPGTPEDDPNVPGENPGDPSDETTAPTEETTAPTEAPKPNGGTTGGTKPAVSSTTFGADDSELKMQLAIVNGLNRYDYTASSWDQLQAAYGKGKEALDSNDQKTIDTAAQEIKQAVAQLVDMDYSKLESALLAVNDLIKENPQLYDVLTRLDTMVTDSRPLLTSGDQNAVDEAAQEILALLEERLQYTDQKLPPEVVIQEVEVEVPPTEDYCNIPVHRLWPVLFAVSMVLNAALVVLVIYVLAKKKNRTDDTPLVDYDIEDDF